MEEMAPLVRSPDNVDPVCCRSSGTTRRRSRRVVLLLLGIPGTDTSDSRVRVCSWNRLCRYSVDRALPGP